MLNGREGTDSTAAACGLLSLPSLCGHRLAPQQETWPRMLIRVGWEAEEGFEVVPIPPGCMHRDLG